MRLTPVGMRTFKTGLSVALTLLICNALKIENPFFALIASSMAVESSVSESINVSKYRMIGTMIGATIAIAFSFLFHTNPISVGLGIIALIYISNALKLKKSIKISTIVFVAILVNNDETTRFEYAIYRSLDTFIGLSVGTLVNYYLRPPNSKKDIYKFIEKNTEQLRCFMTKLMQNEPLDHFNITPYLAAVEEKLKLVQNETKLHLYNIDEKNHFIKQLEALKMAYIHLSVIGPMLKPDEPQNVYQYHLEAVESILTASLINQP